MSSLDVKIEQYTEPYNDDDEVLTISLKEYIGDTINEIPVLLGESDLFKVIQNTMAEILSNLTTQLVIKNVLSEDAICTILGVDNDDLTIIQDEDIPLKIPYYKLPDTENTLRFVLLNYGYNKVIWESNDLKRILEIWKCEDDRKFKVVIDRHNGKLIDMWEFHKQNEG